MEDTYTDRTGLWILPTYIEIAYIRDPFGEEQGSDYLHFQYRVLYMKACQHFKIDLENVTLSFKVCLYLWLCLLFYITRHLLDTFWCEAHFTNK